MTKDTLMAQEILRVLQLCVRNRTKANYMFLLVGYRGGLCMYGVEGI